jgi:flagellar biosynthesis chaperone FliJ
MSALVRQRARLARVRRVQHLRAAGDAAQAEGRVTQLEGTADHLARLSQALAPDPGLGWSGAQLGNAAELSMRLDQLRHGMTDSIATARASALEQAARRLEARIAEESASRLEERAAAAEERLREQRRQVPHRPRAGETA